jgi:lysophospholipase L1-like esterase
MIRRLGMVLAVVTTLLVTPAWLVGGGQAAAASSSRVWVFGDSVAAGTWLQAPATESWPARLDAQMDAEVQNFAVGGQAVAYSAPGLPRMDDTVKATFAANAPERPEAVVFAGGINDMIRSPDVGPTRTAVYDLGGWIGQNYPGVRFFAMTVTPYRADAWYAQPLSERRTRFNAWERAMYAPSGQLVDTGDLLTAQTIYADSRYYSDSLHPNAEGAAVLAHGVYEALAEQGIR